MRCWHKDLIPYLPDLQLKGQWRECALIADALAKNGTPNHLLVNLVTEFDPQEFGVYCQRIYDEMQKRKFNPPFDKMCRIMSDIVNWDLRVDAKDNSRMRTIACGVGFKGWHNSEYLRVCMANLYEKHFFGVGKSRITDEEWKILLDGYKEITGEEYKI